VELADLDEQRRLLPDWEYARLHRNRWTASHDRLTGGEDLAACVTLDGPLEARPGQRYVIGLDVGLKHDRTAMALCHGEPWRDGRRVTLDRLSVWTPVRGRPVALDEVEAAVALASRSNGNAPVVFDPHQAAMLAQRLQARGIHCTEFVFSQRSGSRLALTLHDLIAWRRLALPDDGDLLDELANLRLRETAPGVYRVDHDPDRHDDRAIALALAAHAILAHNPPPAPPRSRS
jgi:hypothetical protein